MTNDRCLFCDSRDGLEEHHIVPRRLGGTERDGNLITVCGSCHKKIERTWDQRFYDRLGVRVDMTPNMMFDALKEYHFALQQLRYAIGGAAKMYEKELESAGDATVEDYGGRVTERQVLAIKHEAYQEMLEGGPFFPGDPLADLEEIEAFSYRVLERFQEDSA
jgi:hypothetical protein